MPYVNDFQKNIPTITGERVRRVSDMGIGAILNQTFRLLSHDRLHRAVEIWEERYPGVDIILIEPELDDETMFGTSILDYRARLQIAKHGFESVTLKLARDYDRYTEIAGRHGIKISAAPRPPRPRPGRARAREDVGLAPRARAHQHRAPAQHADAGRGRGRARSAEASAECVAP